LAFFLLELPDKNNREKMRKNMTLWVEENEYSADGDEVKKGR
jgi:hypothetical protein